MLGTMLSISYTFSQLVIPAYSNPHFTEETESQKLCGMPKVMKLING